ncbi:MAG TPA: hypothetical protein VFK38_02180 [Candidatus Limnocylindrales bacterium]|nr:hypothetical protein [Candidatus Limnocylindrales bacterium]
MRRSFSVLAGLALALSSVAGPVAAGGPPSLAFYVDGVRYRTVGTPTDFSGTGAPADTFDAIYALGSGLINVAEAAPGDPGFNGGRWRVLPLTWHVAPVQLTSDEQVEAYTDAGWVSVATTPVKQFECPVIPVQGS